MTTPPAPVVNPYIWDRGREQEHPGAIIRNGRIFVFVPSSDLRTIADQLHDHADTLEAGQ